MATNCCNFNWCLYYWPIAACVWVGFSFLMTYVISAIISRNTYWMLPYISETGVLQPESCYFTFFLHIGVILMAITIFIRYKQIELAIHEEFKFSQKWNVAIFVIGIISCFGFELVADFQASVKNSRWIHNTGAYFGFFLGILHFILQTWITVHLRNYKKIPRRYRIGKILLVCRYIISVLGYPFFFLHLFVGYFAQSKFDGKTNMQWNSRHGGYSLRLVASFSEWIVALFFIIYLVSYIKDFKTLEMNGPMIKVREFNFENQEDT